jgi:bifunctional DNase/RNase
VTSGQTGPSDADLVREALAGDRESLAELLRRHWDTAVFLAARVLGSAELARDAAQEAAIAPALAQITDIPEVKPVTTTDAAEWIDATVAEIRRSQGEDPWQRTHIMMLRERGGERRLPMWIGPAEATALALILEAVEAPRPSTYKLAISLVEAVGARIEEVRITRLLDMVFYACVIVPGPGGPREVDARPSDAVILALATGVPIRVDGKLFDRMATAEHLKDSEPYPVATADIAAETQQRLRDQLRLREQESSQS